MTLAAQLPALRLAETVTITRQFMELVSATITIQKMETVAMMTVWLKLAGLVQAAQAQLKTLVQIFAEMEKDTNPHPIRNSVMITMPVQMTDAMLLAVLKMDGHVPVETHQIQMYVLRSAETERDSILSLLTAIWAI